MLEGLDYLQERLNGSRDRSDEAWRVHHAAGKWMACILLHPVVIVEDDRVIAGSRKEAELLPALNNGSL